MMVGICLPSRGLVYSKTMQGVINGMQALNKIGIATQYFSSHDLPIPDAHNFCVEQALQNPSIDRILMIEEDNFMFEDAFVAVATQDSDMATLQYNDKNGSPHGIIHYNNAGEILWGGVGATMIKRHVFETLGKPYFRIDTRYRIIKKHMAEGKMVVDYEEIEKRQKWDEKTNDFITIADPYKYGGLDVDFYTRARKAGFKIATLSNFRAHHFDLVKLGQLHTNNGCHEIRQV